MLAEVGLASVVVKVTMPTVGIFVLSEEVGVMVQPALVPPVPVLPPVDEPPVPVLPPVAVPPVPVLPPVARCCRPSPGRRCPGDVAAGPAAVAARPGAAAGLALLPPRRAGAARVALKPPSRPPVHHASLLAQPRPTKSRHPNRQDWCRHAHRRTPFPIHHWL